MFNLYYVEAGIDVCIERKSGAALLLLLKYKMIRD